MTTVAITIPDEVIDAITEIVLAKLAASAASTVSTTPYLTVAEAADYIRAKPQRVYDLLSSGRLTRHKDGARVLISRAELEAHLRCATAAGQGRHERNFSTYTSRRKNYGRAPR